MTTHDIRSCHARKDIESILTNQSFVEESHPLFWHGRIFREGSKNASLVPPIVTWESNCKPRDDHDTAEWLTASEYTDIDTVMNEKLDLLANLLRLSRKTVVYSGAGISVAAGIGQASRGAKDRRRNLTTTAVPTLTHHALSALAKKGLIHGWVQQNHDGLPQKAGFPQEDINEIHGSWYDPSNPVVLYSGSLRTYEFEWMEKEAETADLALVIGTTLGGLNADQVATKTAIRSLKKDDASLGMVMINLQQTPHDGKASLRIFGTSDDVFSAVLSRFDVTIPELVPTELNFSERKFLVPYDQNGKRSSSVKMWLDLNPGTAVKIVGHNIMGAKQPSQRHIGKDATGEVKRWNQSTMAVELKVKRATMLLGFWWLEAAMQGKTPTIPVVNTNPDIAVRK